MAERCPDLGPGDRREVLEFAASESGRPASFNILLAIRLKDFKRYS